MSQPTPRTAARAPADHFIELDGRRLHYLAWGDPSRPPLLLLHGGSAHAHWWDWFAPKVADRFHVMALDLRGHGDSAWAEPPAYEIDDYARDVVAFIAHFDLHRLRLIGHSLGGTIAATVAVQIADRLAALVIVDSRTKASPDGLRFMQRLAQMPHPRYRTREQGIAHYRLLPGDSSAPADMLAAIAAHALRPSTDETHWTFKFDRAALAAIRAHDVASALAQLDCPILAVRGGASPLMSEKAIAALRAAAPRLEVATIEGAHHHVMLDRPAEFAAVVTRFLERTSSA
ncbi:MAG TPA: alpha/beta hydrolase [Candidatus Kryptonia bacterium]|nr:alpha/beta hydrolase [Candidatus Kryptonia bacterium]